MRVELLLKRMVICILFCISWIGGLIFITKFILFQGKYGLVPKGRKATSVEKSNSAQVDEPTADREKSSLDNHEELPTTEVGRF